MYEGRAVQVELKFKKKKKKPIYLLLPAILSPKTEIWWSKFQEVYSMV